ncbi:MAG: hypothetical protein ACRYFB_11080 [Janthinobacterium lividum]
MKTSDKQLDDLFNSKLQNLEVEPAANLWQNIDAELDRKPKKKSIIPGLRIAAGILVMLSVGLLFLRKNEPVKSNFPRKITKVVLQKADPNLTQIASLDDKNSMLLLSAKNKVIKEALPRSSKNKVVITKPEIIKNPETKLVLMQTLAQNKPDEDPAGLQNTPIQSRIASVPDASISLKPQPQTEIPQKLFVKPSLLATESHTIKAKHKRIRNIGDVVNLVMAKVDKRQDKLIEFSDTDDGEESNVTGINLGFISLKKEK